MEATFLTLAREGNRTALLKRQILREYIAGGDLSITDLSQAMGLSVPTVTRFVNELMEEGFVYDFGKQGTAGGRKPSIYGLNPSAGYFVGVEIRRESIKLAVMNFKGQILDAAEERTTLRDVEPESVERFVELVRRYVVNQELDWEKVLAVSVNISGRVNSQAGYSYSFFFVEEQPLAKILEERMGCPIYIENDTRAATFGEYRYGEGNGAQTMLYINASWGLGLGMVIDGKLFYGKSGFSGEYGHFPMLDNEIICRCGKRGCLETGASGSAVHRIFLEKLAQGRISLLSKRYEKGEPIALNDILEAMQREDTLAIEVIEGVADTLGKAIAGLINMFNPELIVLGGPLSRAKEYLTLPIKSAINKYSLRLVSKDTSLKLSKLGDNAGVVGACLLARNKSLGLN